MTRTGSSPTQTSATSTGSAEAATSPPISVPTALSMTSQPVWPASRWGKEDLITNCLTPGGHRGAAKRWQQVQLPIRHRLHRSSTAPASSGSGQLSEAERIFPSCWHLRPVLVLWRRQTSNSPCLPGYPCVCPRSGQVRHAHKRSALNFCRCTWKGEANRPECEETDTFHEDFLCPESGFGEYLRYPDPADCRAYYVCVQGSASRSICPAGQAFHPTSVACSEEDNLPPGLCAPGKLWEDRNSTGSGAPTITIPKTRTRQPVSGVVAFAFFCASNTTFQITSTLT